MPCTCESHSDTYGQDLCPYIDTSKVRCLNEKVEGSCRNIFRFMCEKTERNGEGLKNAVEGDPEMILHIPFTAPVKINSICISTSEGATPSKVRMYANREDLDFQLAEELQPVQEIVLAHADENAETFHPLKVAKFGNVTSLQLHFKDGLSSDDVEIFYVGLKGENTGIKRGIPVDIVYESSPQPQDHQVKDEVSRSYIL